MAPPKKRVNANLNNGTSNRKRARSEQLEPSQPSPVDLNSNPKRTFESLIEPESFDNFFSKHWESEPLVIHRTDDASLTEYYTSLFNKKIFLELAGTNEVQFITDVNVVKYEDGVRNNMNMVGRATPTRVQKLFSKGGTFQIHQPQRFQNKLWQLLEKLESFFGCLVGSNVYMTPPGCQGLPPHYDDVEVFILQLEGEKHWRLYKPLVELPLEYSKDLSVDEIGEPTHDFVLKTGDLLYFPRGTIHQAVASEGTTYSTHITISTYQQHTWGNYLLSIFPSLVEEAMAMDVGFRRGLPINFLKSTKLAKSDKMNSVVQLLLQKIKYTQFETPENMLEDFMSSRLPPYGINAEELMSMVPEGLPPSLNSKVKFTYPDHMCFILKKEQTMLGENDESEDDDSDSETEENESPQKATEMLYVYSSICNEYKFHMMGKELEKQDVKFFPCTLKFPKHFLDAMEQLRSNSEQFTLTKDLKLHNDDEKKTLVSSLWASHLLQVQETSSKNSKSTKALKID